DGRPGAAAGTVAGVRGRADAGVCSLPDSRPTSAGEPLTGGHLPDPLRGGTGPGAGGGARLPRPCGPPGPAALLRARAAAHAEGCDGQDHSATGPGRQPFGPRPRARPGAEGCRTGRRGLGRLRPGPGWAEGPCRAGRGPVRLLRPGPAADQSRPEAAAGRAADPPRRTGPPHHQRGSGAGLRRRALPGGSQDHRATGRRVLPGPAGDADRQEPGCGLPWDGRAHDRHGVRALLVRHRAGGRARRAHRRRAARAGGRDETQALAACRGEGAQGAGEDPVPDGGLPAACHLRHHHRSRRADHPRHPRL
ncbi:MAG: Type II/IV secretion system protein TadC, associated with Flp pilus assembly, partial [uncultured Frankineae bacterium]